MARVVERSHSLTCMPTHLSVKGTDRTCLCLPSFLCCKYHLSISCQRLCCISSTVSSGQTIKILHKQSRVFHTRNYHWQQYKNTTHWKITRNTFM